MNDQSQQQQHQSQRDTSTVASSPSLLKKRSRQDRMGVANPPEKSAEEVFFGFHPVSFVDDVVNAVNDYAYDGVDYLEGKLRADRIVARNVQLQNEAAEGSNLVLAQFQQSLDVNFDKLELYLLQNILKIPNDIQLPVNTSFERTLNNNNKNNNNNSNNAVAAVSTTSTLTTATTSSTRSALTAPTAVAVEDEAQLDADLELLLKRVERLRSSRDALRGANSLVCNKLAAMRPFVEACAPIFGGGGDNATSPSNAASSSTTATAIRQNGGAMSSTSLSSATIPTSDASVAIDVLLSNSVERIVSLQRELDRTEIDVVRRLAAAATNDDSSSTSRQSILTSLVDDADANANAATNNDSNNNSASAIDTLRQRIDRKQ